MTGVRYRELRLPSAEDPLSLMARLARSGLFEQYVVYENGPEWSFAGGVLTDLRLDADTCRTAGPAAVENWLAELPVRGWRVYGWAAFEWGAVSAGAGGVAVPGDAADAGVLVHLAVPVGEVRADGEGVLVRAVDEQQLALLARLVRAAPGIPAREPTERVEVRLDDTDGYREAVVAALTTLDGTGPLEKVILSRQVPVPVPLDLVATYVAGRRANTPARSFLVRLGQAHAAGFSPETVAEVTADRLVVSRPLAGTRARTGEPAEDARLRAELLGDPKEIHEHAISVKLALEDLAAVCEETWVAEYLTVQERGTVQHLASTVMGRLRPDRTPWQAFAALFPAVTATGIPKAPAYPLIRRLEGRPRGLYAGAVLTYDTDGTLDAALVLRTVFQRDGHGLLQAGAGIVRQSRPDREHEETCEKLRSVAAHLVPLVSPAPRTAAPPAPGPAKIPAQEEGASDTVAP
ncbi:salicylate synthase [Streptomyces sp. NPDC047072]|uniref:salicylate synthase n=1 Tax=Streptomyces sp. NPDC047072 TaxID=3154809 RepID=UPI0033CA935D